MKKIILLPVLVCAVINLAACATATYHDRFRSAGNERNEFRDFDEKYRVYKGTLSADAAVKDNREYYELQFSGVLGGEGRFLNILLPYDNTGKPLIYESTVEIKNGKPAYLFLVRSCCTDEYREILDPITSREIEKDPDRMKKYIAEKFPGSSGKEMSPVVFCELSFTNVNYFSLIYKVWKPYGGQPYCGQGFLLEEPYSSIKVKWEQRSRIKYCLVKAGYILPVLADIATSPIQLVGVIIYFAAGGAAR